MLRSTAALLAVLALSGCTVPVVGGVGVSLNAEGSLVGYVAVCEQHIDGVTMYINDESGPLGEGRDVGRWASTTAVTSGAQLSLDDASPGWETELPPSDLRLEQHYTLYGWTVDGSGSTTDLTFTLDQLRELQPGQVLYFGGYDERADKDLQRVGSVSDFSEFTCQP